LPCTILDLCVESPLEPDSYADPEGAIIQKHEDAAILSEAATSFKTVTYDFILRV
jgi:hypothetical protein